MTCAGIPLRGGAVELVAPRGHHRLRVRHGDNDSSLMLLSRHLIIVPQSATPSLVGPATSCGDAAEARPFSRETLLSARCSSPRQARCVHGRRWDHSA